VISEKYWPYGGAELATHLILKMLNSHGIFKITVLTGCRNPERISGVNYIYNSFLDAPTKIHLWRNLAIMGKNLSFKRLVKWADIIYIPRIAYPVIPLIKNLGKKIVVHLHNYQPINFQSTILYPFEKHSGCNFVKDVKYSLMLETLECGNLKRSLASSILSPINSLCRFWLPRADVIICVSEKQALIISKEMPELADKIKVIYNLLPSIPLAEKSFSNVPSILYMGGDLYTKGFYVFLETSYRLLKREGIKVRFLLTKIFRKENKFLIERLNRVFDNAYALLGWVKYKEVFKLHSVAHALLFPSIWEEPLPYVVIESMLAGTIPIASRVGGIPEIVQGTYAEEMLFTPGNITELIDKIEVVLSLSREQLTDIGISLREATLRKFNNEKIKKQLLKIFEA